MAISVAKMNGLLLFLMTIGAIIATDAAGAGDDRIMQRTTASSDGPDPAGGKRACSHSVAARSFMLGREKALCIYQASCAFSVNCTRTICA